MSWKFNNQFHNSSNRNNNWSNDRDSYYDRFNNDSPSFYGRHCTNDYSSRWISTHQEVKYPSSQPYKNRNFNRTEKIPSLLDINTNNFQPQPRYSNNYKSNKILNDNPGIWKRGCKPALLKTPSGVKKVLCEKEKTKKTHTTYINTKKIDSIGVKTTKIGSKLFNSSKTNVKKVQAKKIESSVVKAKKSKIISVESRKSNIGTEKSKEEINKNAIDKKDSSDLGTEESEHNAEVNKNSASQTVDKITQSCKDKEINERALHENKESSDKNTEKSELNVVVTENSDIQAVKRIKTNLKDKEINESALHEEKNKLDKDKKKSDHNTVVSKNSGIQTVGIIKPSCKDNKINGNTLDDKKNRLDKDTKKSDQNTVTKTSGIHTVGIIKPSCKDNKISGTTLDDEKNRLNKDTKKSYDNTVGTENSCIQVVGITKLGCKNNEINERASDKNKDCSVIDIKNSEHNAKETKNTIQAVGIIKPSCKDNKINGSTLDEENHRKDKDTKKSNHNTVGTENSCIQVVGITKLEINERALDKNKDCSVIDIEKSKHNAKETKNTIQAVGITKPSCENNDINGSALDEERNRLDKDTTKSEHIAVVTKNSVIQAVDKIKPIVKDKELNENTCDEKTDNSNINSEKSEQKNVVTKNSSIQAEEKLNLSCKDIEATKSDSTLNETGNNYEKNKELNPQKISLNLVDNKVSFCVQKVVNKKIITDPSPDVQLVFEKIDRVLPILPLESKHENKKVLNEEIPIIKTNSDLTSNFNENVNANDEVPILKTNGNVTSNNNEIVKACASQGHQETSQSITTCVIAEDSTLNENHMKVKNVLGSTDETQPQDQCNNTHDKVQNMSLVNFSVQKSSNNTIPVLKPRNKVTSISSIPMIKGQAIAVLNRPRTNNISIFNKVSSLIQAEARPICLPTHHYNIPNYPDFQNQYLMSRTVLDEPVPYNMQKSSLCEYVQPNVFIHHYQQYNYHPNDHNLTNNNHYFSFSDYSRSDSHYLNEQSVLQNKINNCTSENLKSDTLKDQSVFRNNINNHTSENLKSDIIKDQSVLKNNINHLSSENLKSNTKSKDTELPNAVIELNNSESQINKRLEHGNDHPTILEHKKVIKTLDENITLLKNKTSFELSKNIMKSMYQLSLDLKGIGSETTSFEENLHKFHKKMKSELSKLETIGEKNKDNENLALMVLNNYVLSFCEEVKCIKNKKIPPKKDDDLLFPLASEMSKEHNFILNESPVESLKSTQKSLDDEILNFLATGIEKFQKKSTVLYDKIHRPTVQRIAEISSTKSELSLLDKFPQRPQCRNTKEKHSSRTKSVRKSDISTRNNDVRKQYEKERRTLKTMYSSPSYRSRNKEEIPEWGVERMSTRFMEYERNNDERYIESTVSEIPSKSQNKNINSRSKQELERLYSSTIEYPLKYNRFRSPPRNSHIEKRSKRRSEKNCDISPIILSPSPEKSNSSEVNPYSVLLYPKYNYEQNFEHVDFNESNSSHSKGHSNVNLDLRSKLKKRNVSPDTIYDKSDLYFKAKQIIIERKFEAEDKSDSRFSTTTKKFKKYQKLKDLENYFKIKNKMQNCRNKSLTSTSKDSSSCETNLQIDTTTNNNIESVEIPVEELEKSVEDILDFMENKLPSLLSDDDDDETNSIERQTEQKVQSSQIITKSDITPMDLEKVEITVDTDLQDLTSIVKKDKRLTEPSPITNKKELLFEDKSLEENAIISLKTEMNSNLLKSVNHEIKCEKNTDENTVLSDNKYNLSFKNCERDSEKDTSCRNEKIDPIEKILVSNDRSTFSTGAPNKTIQHSISINELKIDETEPHDNLEDGADDIHFIEDLLADIDDAFFESVQCEQSNLSQENEEMRTRESFKTSESNLLEKSSVSQSDIFQNNEILNNEHLKVKATDSLETTCNTAQFSTEKKKSESKKYQSTDIFKNKEICNNEHLKVNPTEPVEATSNTAQFSTEKKTSVNNNIDKSDKNPNVLSKIISKDFPIDCKMNNLKNNKTKLPDHKISTVNGNIKSDPRINVETKSKTINEKGHSSNERKTNNETYNQSSNNKVNKIQAAIKQNVGNDVNTDDYKDDVLDSLVKHELNMMKQFSLSSSTVEDKMFTTYNSHNVSTKKENLSRLSSKNNSEAVKHPKVLKTTNNEVTLKYPSKSSVLLEQGKSEDNHCSERNDCNTTFKSSEREFHQKEKKSKGKAKKSNCDMKDQTKSIVSELSSNEVSFPWKRKQCYPDSSHSSSDIKIIPIEEKRRSRTKCVKLEMGNIWKVDVFSTTRDSETKELHNQSAQKDTSLNNKTDGAGPENLNLSKKVEFTNATLSGGKNSTPETKKCVNKVIKSKETPKLFGAGEKDDEFHRNSLDNTVYQKKCNKKIEVAPNVQNEPLILDKETFCLKKNRLSPSSQNPKKIKYTQNGVSSDKLTLCERKKDCSSTQQDKNKFNNTKNVELPLGKDVTSLNRKRHFSNPKEQNKLVMLEDSDMLSDGDEILLPLKRNCRTCSLEHQNISKCSKNPEVSSDKDKNLHPLKKLRSCTLKNNPKEFEISSNEGKNLLGSIRKQCSSSLKHKNNVKCSENSQPSSNEEKTLLKKCHNDQNKLICSENIKRKQRSCNLKKLNNLKSAESSDEIPRLKGIRRTPALKNDFLSEKSKDDCNPMNKDTRYPRRNVPRLSLADWGSDLDEISDNSLEEEG